MVTGTFLCDLIHFNVCLVLALWIDELKPRAPTIKTRFYFLLEIVVVVVHDSMDMIYLDLKRRLDGRGA